MTILTSFHRPTWLTLGVAALLTSSALGARAQEYFDDTNGLWSVTLNGQATQENALTENYPPGGRDITLRFKDKVVKLDKSGNSLKGGSARGMTGILGGESTAIEVDLTLKGLDTSQPCDDTMEGEFYGQTAVFRRDTRSKPPIVLKLPGDRPWVRFMREVLIPATARDRETYHTFRPDEARRFLTSCQLYLTGYWMGRYMKGGCTQAGKLSFERMLTGNQSIQDPPLDPAVQQGMAGLTISPRSISSSAFGKILMAQMDLLKQDLFALAKSRLGMYFSTAAGGAVRIHVTDNDDSIVYYITDRCASSRNGSVVTLTPTHPPLTSSFGKWLLDLSAIDYSEDPAFTRAILETMVKSSSKAANQLKSGNDHGHGRSAYTDYLGVMAIEDQRGVMFGNDDLPWGYNMTSGTFTALIARALSHGEKRKAPDLVKILGDTRDSRKLAQRLNLKGDREELDIKVIVEDGSGEGAKLQPGDCSYFDTLNRADNVLAGEGTAGGHDFQEGQGMATLRRLTTKWLRAKHAAKVKALEDELVEFIPKDKVSNPGCILHHMCEVFFHAEKFSKVTPAQGDEIIEAAMAVMSAIRSESRDLEKFILENGVTESTDWAPRASGL